MRIAMTGATGFIGRALSEALAAKGHAVLALTRRPDAAKGDFGAGVEVFGWDPGKPAPLPPCDAVVHLAGESVAGRWTTEKKRKIRDSRVQGTRSLVDSIARMDAKPSALVSASGIGYYGDRGEEVLTEAAPPGEDFLAQVCVEWEAEAQRAETLGLRVARVRLGVVLDEGGGALPLMALPIRLGVGGKLGSGRQWVAWIHRDDAVGLFRHALERDDLSGPVNACAPEPIRNAELTKELAKVLHRPAIVPVPAFALRLVVGEMAETLLGGQRALPKAVQETGYAFQYPTLRAALEEIY